MNYNINIIYKKVKNLTLRIKEDGRVNLTVPFGISKEEALKFVHKKEKWIVEKLNIIEKRNKKENSTLLLHEDNIYYLGRVYTLNIIKSPLNKAVLKDEILEIYVDNVDNFQKKSEILKSWYLEKAMVIFEDKIRLYEKNLGLKVNALTIRPMKTRWGSCNSKLKKINLNLHLIEKDEKCIEYVVLHEMAHIVHPNHSNNFWSYVETYMKDYKIIRNKLNKSFS